MVGWLWRLADWLWPATCVACGQPGSWWCDACDAEVVRVLSPVCPGCRRLTTDGRYCPRCRPKTALTGIVAGAHYRQPLPTAIKALKYRHARQVAIPLARYLIPPLARIRGLNRADLVTVPLHPARARHRGHNQAELLATTMQDATGIPWRPGLERIRNTPSQTGLRRPERAANMKDAFRWTGGSLRGRIVVVVDDIATTGATLNACAVALRQAGAQQVWGLVVAQR